MPFDAEAHMTTDPRRAAALAAEASRPTLARALAAYDAALGGSNEFTLEDAAHLMAAVLRAPKASRKASAKESHTFTAANLLGALKALGKVIERRSTIPVLAMVLIEASGGRVTLTGTDMDMVMVTTLRGYDGPEFSACVDAAKLAGLLKGASSCAFEPGGADGERLGVRIGEALAHLPSQPAKDFPIMLCEPAAVAMMDAAALADALGFVQPYISSEEARYYLNGANMAAHHQDGRTVLRFAATDGHRLAAQTMDAPEWDGEAPDSMIIPRKSVAVLLAALPKAGEIMVEASPQNLRFTLPNGVFVTKLIDGTFPDISRVIPQYEGKARIAIADPKAFGDALGRLLSIASDRSKAVRMVCAGAVEAVVRNMESGVVSSAMPAEHEGEPAEFSFNGSYLATTANEPCVLNAWGPNDPLRIDYDGRPDRLAVIMPLRA